MSLGTASGQLVARVMPGTASLPALLATAALLANLVNNLPAVLLLLPAAGGGRKRLFPEDASLIKFELVEVHPTRTGLQEGP
jgi:Na+/H+ antiporter NhaD/arsenite permease-like protein